MLTSVRGLDNVTDIPGSLLVIGNSELSSLHGLSRLEFLGGDMWIESNPRLSSLQGLSTLPLLTTVGRDLVSASYIERKLAWCVLPF